MADEFCNDKDDYRVGAIYRCCVRYGKDASWAQEKLSELGSVGPKKGAILAQVWFCKDPIFNNREDLAAYEAVVKKHGIPIMIAQSDNIDTRVHAIRHWESARLFAGIPLPMELLSINRKSSQIENERERFFRADKSRFWIVDESGTNIEVENQTGSDGAHYVRAGQDLVRRISQSGPDAGEVLGEFDYHRAPFEVLSDCPTP